MNASYLLTATVRWEKSGGASRVHVSPELVDVTRPDAPTSKWQQPFDAALTDVFQVQSDIATRVAQALGVALGAGEEKRLSEKPTQNLAAYDAFLKGEATSKAMAVNDPPRFARLSASTSRRWLWTRVSRRAGRGSRWPARSCTRTAFRILAWPSAPDEAAEKAIALAPDRPGGYLALGNYERLIVHDMARARWSSSTKACVSRPTEVSFGRRRRSASRPSEARQRPVSTQSRPNASIPDVAALRGWASSSRFSSVIPRP